MNLRHSLSSLPEAAFSDERISFREIVSEDDLAWATCDLQLPPDQQDMVNPAGFSIGRAYLFPEDNIPYLICKREDGTPIGFISLCFSHWSDDKNRNRWCSYITHPSTSWSYFIVPEYQGKGFGKAAAKLAVRILLEAAPDYPIELSTEQENLRAQKLYTEIGFVKTNELDGDDLVYLYQGA